MTLLLLAACKSTPSATDSTDVPTPQPMLDVSERLGPGEVRAGVIADEAALFGGITAEGQIGDFKIYNDRVQFIVQAERQGDYYLQLGGGVIDADIVRPLGEPGRDFVEEWNTMLGFGRVIDPESIEVVDNGTSGEAVIRVSGPDAPLALLGGALEAPELVQAQGLEVVTEYRLRPDSLLLEVSTTITASEDINALAMGDLLLGAPELAHSWTGGAGLAASLGAKPITGYIGARNDGAIAIVPAAGEMLQSSATADLLTGLVDLVLGFDLSGSLAAGESRTWTRYWGAGPDLAALTDARLANEPTDTVSGTVTAPDGPVAGARVHLLIDDTPYTIAVSGPDGSFEARVPAGSNVTYATDGAGRGMFTDLPAGVASWAPYAVDAVKAEATASLAHGGPVRPYAQGRGVVEGLELGEPGIVRVSVDDGLPFTARVGPAIAFPDRRVAVGRPNGLAGAGWSRGGTVDIAVEPGSYDVLVHRGARYELHQEQIEVAAGEVVEVTGTLVQAFEHPGYVFGDPHSHASPSGDGEVSMEERLMVHAAGGVQLHFGSDHDRVADYRPLVAALDLGGVLQSIVADEVSSPLRGHMNAYPLEPDPELPNNGAVSWWAEIPDTTQQISDRIRERHGDDVIVQSNHPLDTGVAEAAGWSVGSIGSPGFWVQDLDAMEVLNDGAHDEYFQVFLDLTARGYLVAPTGVSDAHGHFSGPAGINGTWFGTDSAVGAVSHDDLRNAVRTGDLQVGLGVFLELSEPPGSTFTEPTTLQVTARSASYAPVDRLVLYENGTAVQTIEGNTGSFVFDAPADTVYVVTAEGDASMQPLSSRRPWATTNVYLFDRGGDGWNAPLPPLDEG